MNVQNEMHFQPAARSSDPISSHEAAEAITDSGKRQTQAMLVYLAVLATPNHTSAELAKMHGFNRHMVARRTADLEHSDKIEKSGMRKCEVNGGKAVTWA